MSVSGVSAWLVELSCPVAGAGVLEVVRVSFSAMTMHAVTLVFAMRLLEGFYCRYSMKNSKTI